MPAKKFKGMLKSAGQGGVFIPVPYDVQKAYGKKNLIPVKVTYDGMPYRGSIANMGNGPCLIVLKSIREKLGKGPGDTVRVTVELDAAPRKIEIPSSVKSLLRDHPTEKAFFDALSFSHRKEYVRWITDAKRPETKASRLKKMLEKLKEKRRNPSMK